MSRTTFVTGATGFAGNHLTRALVKRGDRVKVLVRSQEKLNGLLDLGVEPVIGDLTGELPEDMLAGVDTVFHLAAAFRSEDKPADYFFKVNTEGTERLLEAAYRCGVSRFVHCSTIGVLGHIENPPADEKTPYNPHDHYQMSKMLGEQRALQFYRDHGLPVTVVRPGSIYGPGDMRLHKLFKAINRQIFRMIGKGENHFHLVYIKDLVNGFLLAEEKDEALGEVFIICGEQPVQVKELVHMIADILGKPVPRGSIPLGPAMLAARAAKKVFTPLGINPPIYPRRLDFFISSRYFSIEKARRMLGYQPGVDLLTGLTRTVEWYQQHNLI